MTNSQIGNNENSGAKDEDPFIISFHRTLGDQIDRYIGRYSISHIGISTDDQDRLTHFAERSGEVGHCPVSGGINGARDPCPASTHESCQSCPMRHVSTISDGRSDGRAALHAMSPHRRSVYSVNNVRPPPPPGYLPKVATRPSIRIGRNRGHASRSGQVKIRCFRLRTVKTSKSADFWTETCLRCSQMSDKAEMYCWRLE